MAAAKISAFTLIELAIVLVIIGLLIGGILIGRDLINAARINAQISQIDQFNAALEAFRVKYGGLPGDLIATNATQFGFGARGAFEGEGDGNGIIEGNRANASWSFGGWLQDGGETQMFWSDLSTSGLIAGAFTAGSSTVAPSTPISGTLMDSYFPAAKIEEGNYIFAYSNSSRNYFQLEADYVQGTPNNGQLGTVNGETVTPQEAFNIDIKADDGMPQSGLIMAQIQARGVWNQYDSGPSNPTALQAIWGYCYDNGNVAGVVRHYTRGMAWHAAAGTNQLNLDTPSCGLSFKMQ